MSPEDFIVRYGLPKDGDPRNPDTGAMRIAATEALAELAALREQVKTARLEGARAAWRIAYNNVPVMSMVDWADADDAYLVAFVEEAPL